MLAAAIGATGAIVGGLLAAALSQALGIRGQRRRQWEEIRHEAYADVIQKFYVAWGLYDEQGSLQADRVRERAAGDELLVAYSKAVFLTTTKGTADGLEQLFEAAQQLWMRGSKSWGDVDKVCQQAEARFQSHARAELGLPKVKRKPQLAD